MSDNLWPDLIKRPAERKPEEILKEQCDLINEKYARVICARMQRLDKSLAEYTKAPLLDMTEAMASLTVPRTVESFLGETDYGRSIKYELVITSPKIPSYKYRILFLQHGLSAYPTYLYVEKPIAKEFQTFSSPEKIESEEAFMQVIAQVLGSARVREVLSRIISYDNEF